MGTKIRTVVVSGELRAILTGRGIRELSEVMIMFDILPGVVETQIYAFFKTQNAHLNCVFCIVCQFYIKRIKLCTNIEL